MVGEKARGNGGESVGNAECGFKFVTFAMLRRSCGGHGELVELLGWR